MLKCGFMCTKLTIHGIFITICLLKKRTGIIYFYKHDNNLREKEVQ